MSLKKLTFVLSAVALAGFVSSTHAAVKLDNPSHELTEAEYPGEVMKLIKREDYDKAYRYIRDGLRLNPDNVQLKFLRTIALERHGRLQQAADELNQMIRRYPEIAEPYNNLANIYAKEGRLDEAQELLNTAIRLRPSYAIAHENLAKLYLLRAKGEFSLAQKHGLKEKEALDVLSELLK